MYRKIFVWPFLLFGGGLSLFGLQKTEAATTSQARIVVLKGSAKIIRKNVKKPRSASIGMVIRNEDLIKPEVSTVLKVMCADNQVQEVESGVFSGLAKICPADTTSSVFDPRGEDDFLQFLDRRSYKITLLDAKQAIRWSQVPGVKGYRVQLGTKESFLLDKQVSRPPFIYEEKALQAGVDYNCLVTALGNKASVVLRLSFRVLDTPEHQELDRRVVLVKANPNLSGVVQAIALADVYGDYGLTEQAIDVLKNAGSSIAIQERMLGNFALQAGLRDLAEGHYRKSLGLAGLDVEGLAEAQVGLAKVLVAGGNKQGAGVFLRKAIGNYRILEDQAKVKAIEGWLKKVLL
jgi:hypothetical protein